MAQKSISIKEIAKMANVSVATVSRVINNNGRFSKETKEKVEALIKEHGYTTNIAAKSLRLSLIHIFSFQDFFYFPCYS